MNRILTLLSLMLMMALHIGAQTTLNGTIKDRESQNPIEFANVVAYNPADTTFITGATTDEQGRFCLSNVTLPVLIKVTLMGYTTHTQTVTAGGDMGTITLAADSKMLNEVTVTGKLIKQNTRGFTTTIQNTPLAKMGTLNDVLGQLPFLTVTGKNVEVFGSGSPIYYINNRQVRNDNELTDLQPANIKNIEVITSPGPQYPAGTGAVIRITTHRPQGEGLGGNINEWVQFDRKVSSRSRVRLNYRQGNFDIFGGLTYSLYNSKSTQYADIINGKWYVNATGEGTSKMNSWNPTVGFNHIIGKKHYIGAQYWFSHMPWDNITTGNNSLTAYKNGSKTQSTLTQMEYWLKQNSHSGTMYYRWEIGKEQALQVDFDMGLYSNQRSQEQEIFANQGAGQDLILADHTKSQFFAGKMVYTFPIKKVSMGIGVEGTHSKITAEQGQEGDKETPMKPTNNVSLQNSYAAFAEGMFCLGKFNFSLGFRLEHVNFNYYLNNKYNTDASQKYTRIYPSMAIAYNHKDFHTSVSYTYHIVQPTYSELNNTYSYENDYVYNIGNPLIKNSFYHNVNYKIAWRDLRLTGNYRYVRNRIVHTYDHMENVDSVIVERALNLHSYQSFSVGLAYSPKIKWWSPTFEVNFSKPFTKIDGVSYNHPLWAGRWKNQLSLPSDFNVFFNLAYSSLAHANLTTKHQDFIANMRVTKSLLKKRLNFTLSANDLFNTSSRYRYTRVQDIVLTQNTSNTIRSIEFSVTYNFNSTRSKFRGTGAGNTERSRIQ